MEILTDPDINDPSKWYVNPPAFVVTGGQYVITSGYTPGLIADQGAQLLTVGDWYGYEIIVDTVDTSSRGGIYIAGNLNRAWRPIDGPGKFRGAFEASEQWAAKITVGTFAFPLPPDPTGTFTLDRISVFKMHARQTIREAAATLVTGLATTGANVFQSRAYNVQENDLPALFVYTVNETVERGTIGNPLLMDRTLELVIEGKAIATANLDDTLDDIGEEVETVIGADPTLGIEALDCVLADVQADYSVEGDKPIGSIVMRFVVSYRTEQDAPGTIIR